VRLKKGAHSRNLREREMEKGSLYILAGALSPLVEWGGWLPYSLVYVNLTEYLMAWLTFPSNKLFSENFRSTHMHHLVA